ncbi:hypothetical protein PCASD_18818, partial [Puccinia coronata f. sp. avenae]
PEMLAGKKYLGEEVDIWSLGIILHALLTGSLPFDDDDEEQMKTLIMKGHFEVPNFVSNEASNLIQSILKQDPKARPSIEQILSHPWFTTPPLHHTFGEGEPLCRPSPIIEETQQLLKSPSATLEAFASADQPFQTSSQDSQPISSSKANQSSYSVFDSDASGLSSKESDLSVSSGRSSTSSPVTSEDLPPQMPAIPDLGLSSSDRSAGSAKSKSNSNWQNTLLLKHSNSSHSTIKNSHSSIPYNPLQHLPTHAEDENDTSPFEVDFSANSDQRHGASSQSSTAGPSSGQAGGSKPRPLSILASAPSSLAHSQIRTPSRTKRRSVGSTLSERIGPFEDSPSDFVTPTPNQSRLSTSSLLTVVIDYVGALKATTQAPLLSQDDLTFLTSLSVLGFDTGQIIHSVQSYACDTSGALWWLLKRKKDKQNVIRDDPEADYNRAATKDPFSTTTPPEVQSSESLNRDDLLHSPEESAAPASAPSKATVSIMNLPEDFPKHPSKSAQQSSNPSKKPTTPRKVKQENLNSPKIESFHNLGKPEKESGTESSITGGHRSYLNLKANFGGSSKNNSLAATPHNYNDDTCSTTSSAKIDTHSNTSDKETPCITVDLAAPPSKKSTSDQRKRSQSVSMLHRATHALGTKKSADEKHSKSRSREGSSTHDGDEKPEKISKKDFKARERESRTEEHSKASGSLPLSGLFSRKTLLIPSLPPLPASLMLHQPSGGSDKSGDKSANKPKELDVPVASCLPASRPSSPLKAIESPLRSRDDGDPVSNNISKGQSINVTPALPGSFTSLNRALQNVPSDHPDPFSTPKPNSPTGTSNPTPSSFKNEERESLRKTSPTVSPLVEGTSTHQPSPPETNTIKSGRPKGPKGNLFSSFRFWFNEDRRKRKQNMAMIVNYGHTVKSPTRMGGQNPSPNLGGGGGSVPSSSRGSEFPSRKVAGDLQAMRSVSGSVLVHRRPSKGSRRSSFQSTRQLSLELHATSKAASKRRSGSSRASFGSITDARTPGSEPGSHASVSQYVITPNRGSMEGPGRGRRHDAAHARHGSISSAGSRRSAAALQLMSHHSASGYTRRTPSVGTTVRRVTAPSICTTASIRHRQPRSSSVASSSVRTSMSSDDGNQLMNGRSSSAEDHRLHSPNNVYDVEETIEEEDDGNEETQADDDNETPVRTAFDLSPKTDAARQSAFQKLSGDTHDKGQSRLSLEGGGTTANASASGGGTRTIFMAHKPHSVFGTPTQAFFARSSQSPLTTKFNSAYGAGNSSVLAYVNLMNSIADGPSSSSSRKSSSGAPKLRDVFANKAKEEGEWVDLDDDDNECGRYEGGIGQGVKSRNPAGTTAANRPGGSGLDGKSASGFAQMNCKLPGKDSSGKPPSSLQIFYGKATPATHASTTGHAHPSATSTHLAVPPAGNSPAAGLIGNWRGGNPRVTPTFKSVAIEEEEEED